MGGLRKCVQCGSLNQDSDANCGVCGRNLTALETSSHVAVAASRRIHARGLLGLVVGIMLLAAGVLLLGTWAAPLGFFVLVFGVASVGAVIGMFKGLPYQPNPGWHTGGDPDLVATATLGAEPVNVQMLEVDRERESREKEEKSD